MFELMIMIDMIYPVDVYDMCDLASGWHQYAGKCYKQFDDRLTWYDARGYCEGQGSTLVMLKTQAEIEAFGHLQTCNDYTTNIWIGLSDTVSVTVTSLLIAQVLTSRDVAGVDWSGSDVVA